MMMGKLKTRRVLFSFFLACLLGKGVFLYAAAPAFSVFDIGVSSLNSKSVLVRWTTDVLANSQVEYGLDESYGNPDGRRGNRSDLDLTQVLSHAVKLNDLKPGLIYFYRVTSTDVAGNRMVSQRFVFVAPAIASAVAVVSGTAPILTFTSPTQHDVLQDQKVSFTYQISGDWPSAGRIPHIYLWADELRNGTWVERTRASDIGIRTSAALRSGSFIGDFSPGTYRIDGMLAAYEPKHEVLRGSRVVPIVFTVWDASSTEVVASSSSSLLALPSGPKFQSGDRIRNWRAADVRQVPSKSGSLIGVQAPNTKGTLIGSPETVGESRWWNINYDVGYDGWTSEESLLPVNAPVFDFELAALNDGDVALEQGSSNDFSFGGRLTSGVGQQVAFSADGVPTDAYGVFSPPSCMLPCLTTLHLSTMRTVPVGVYHITVTAVSAKKEKKLSFNLRTARFSPVPSVSLSAPFIDGVVPGSNITLSSTVLGDTDLFGVRTIRFRLDNGKESVDTRLNGPHLFTDIPTGSHVLTGYLGGNSGAKIKGTDFSLPFVSDSTLPVTSGLASQHVGDTSAVIVWTTDKNSTTRVAHDGVNDLRFSTTEDTGVFQRTHSVSLQSLIPCAQYAYRAYSKNSAGAEAMSLISRFATTGCLASMLPDIHAEGVVSALAGGVLTLSHDDRLVRVALPSGFSDTATLEINALDPAGAGSAAPAPTSQSRLVGGHVYRVLVLKDPSTSIFTSDKPVSLTMRYLPGDIKDTVPGTLKIWRWTGVDWSETNQCHTDEDAGEVTCMTNEISTFGLFGISSKLSLAPPPGSLILVTPPPESKTTKDIPESTPLVVAHASSTLKNIKTSPPFRVSPTGAHALTMDLYRGIKSSEVKLLQQFLISRNYLAADENSGFFNGTTETAVKKFQCDQGIICEGTPSTTGFGSVDKQTRDKINPLLK